MLLGDLIEVCVFGMVLGCGWFEDFLLFIGFVKINFGYIEVVVGIVGFIKMVLVV